MLVILCWDETWTQLLPQCSLLPLLLFVSKFYQKMSEAFFQSVHLHSELSLKNVYICVRALQICFLYMLFKLAPLIHQKLKCYFQSGEEVRRNIEDCCVLSVSDGKAWGSFSLCEDCCLQKALVAETVFSHKRLGLMCLQRTWFCQCHKGCSLDF